MIYHESISIKIVLQSGEVINLIHYSVERKFSSRNIDERIAGQDTMRQGSVQYHNAHHTTPHHNTTHRI